VINTKTTAVLQYITDYLLDPDDREHFITRTLSRSKKLASSTLTEIILLLFVFASLVSLWKSGFYQNLERTDNTWMTSGSPEEYTLSLAGSWAIFISVPLFQFLLLRWIWRYIIWLFLLFRISKAPLKLSPLHADRSGGVGIIILAQRSFNMIFVACSVVIAGQFMAKVIQDHDAFNSIRGDVIGFIILCVILIVLPLVFFAGRLLKTKQLGLLHMSQVGAELSHKFEQDWMNDMPIEQRIEKQQVDPSMAYDYSTMFDTLQQLRIVPITLRDLIGMAVILFIPFIPILFIYYSALELLQKILGLLM
jgi:hypothetical protein